MIGQDDPHRPRSISEQLAPLASQFRKAYSTVRPVSQSVIEFQPLGSTSPFATIRSIVLDWVKDRAGRPLPSGAWKGESFELEDIGSQRTAAVGIEAPPYWAARLDDSDREVPQRNWVNEIGIADRGEKGTVLGSRLLCVTRGQDRPYQPSIQRFLRTALERVGGAHVEGRPIDSMPWLVETEEDVELL